MKKILAVFLIFLAGMAGPVLADQKNWMAGGDKSDWFDDANWYPAATPTAADDAIVDILDASVDVPRTFHAQSITLGGKKASTIGIDNFTEGDVIPAAVSDDAIYNRKNGLFVMKGSAGKVKLSGTYRTSRATVAEEPSFMFYAQ